MENTPIILNLAGALSEELSKYFASKGIRVIDSLENSLLSWTHILVKDLDTFDAIGDTYGTLDNNIRLISLSQPQDLKNFMMNNGKLVLDETWLTSSFGPFLLDKFFQDIPWLLAHGNDEKSAVQELIVFNPAIETPRINVRWRFRLIHERAGRINDQLAANVHFE